MGGAVIEIKSKAQWNEELAKAGDKPVLVDFSAQWCGPCKQIAPLYAKLSEEFPNIVFLKVDTDENQEVAREAGISAMPTFQLYRNGKKVEEFMGADPKKLRMLVEKHAAAPVAA